MIPLIRRLRSLLIAVTALALSAGLAYGAMPPAASTGLANAASHAGKTVPVAGGQAQTLGEDEDTVDNEDAGEEAGEDEETDGDTSEDVESEVAGAGGENCLTDPTALAVEQLDALKHGSIVCWAAHQTDWPEWFSSHGAFVRCWAHQGKADAASCTEDPETETPASEDPAAGEPTADTTKAARGKGLGKGKGQAKNQK